MKTILLIAVVFIMDASWAHNNNSSWGGAGTEMTTYAPPPATAVVEPPPATPVLGPPVPLPDQVPYGSSEPYDSATTGMGSTNVSCAAGMQATPDLSGCAPCPRGTWKGVGGYQNCRRCGVAMSTEFLGTTTKDNCISLSTDNAAQLTLTLDFDIDMINMDYSDFQYGIESDLQAATGASYGRIAFQYVVAGSVVATVEIYDTSDYGEQSSKYLASYLQEQYETAGSILYTGQYTFALTDFSYYIIVPTPPSPPMDGDSGFWDGNGDADGDFAYVTRIAIAAICVTGAVILCCCVSVVIAVVYTRRSRALMKQQRIMVHPAAPQNLRMVWSPVAPQQGVQPIMLPNAAMTVPVPGSTSQFNVQLYPSIDDGGERGGGGVDIEDQGQVARGMPVMQYAGAAATVDKS